MAEDRVDPKAYLETPPEERGIEGFEDLSPQERDVLLRVGIDPGGEGRSGSFFQCDHRVVACGVQEDGVEVLPISMALDRYGLEEYWWQVVDPDKDAFTRRALEHQEEGYFIRSHPGAKVTYPLQACLYISVDRLAQDVHNVIIAEEGSELHVITGCATAPHVRSGLHVGISEFYVKRGARLIFTMIHNWPEEMAVRPRTGILVEEGATFISNYVCLMPAGDLQSYPTAFLMGKGGVATFQSVLLATPGSLMDVGARAVLEAEGTRAEVVSRNVSTGGRIIARGHLVGEATGVRGHLECRGLMLSPEGLIHAVPELEARVAGVELSHEAAVGKIAREEIEYLMARGLSEEEATSLIIKGFLSLEIEGLPPSLKEDLDKIIAETEKAL